MQQEVCVLLDGFIETQVVVTLFSSSASATNVTGIMIITMEKFLFINNVLSHYRFCQYS